MSYVRVGSQPDDVYTKALPNLWIFGICNKVGQDYNINDKVWD